MKKIVRLTENDLTRIVKRVLKEQKEILRLVEEDERSLGSTPFAKIPFGGASWNIKSPTPKGPIGVVDGSITPRITRSNGEEVYMIDIMFPVGGKQVVYRGEIMKTSEAATGPEDVGTWVWRKQMFKQTPNIDTKNSSFESNRGQKLQADEFMDQLSKNKQDASVFVKTVLEPIIGLY